MDGVGSTGFFFQKLRVGGGPLRPPPRSDPVRKHVLPALESNFPFQLASLE